MTRGEALIHFSPYLLSGVLGMVAGIMLDKCKNWVLGTLIIACYIWVLLILLFVAVKT